MSRRKSPTLFRLLFGSALILLTILFAVPAGAEPAAPEAPDSTLVQFDGLFNLTQRDGPNCRFSGAPFTSGTVELFFNWGIHTGTVEMKGDGQGWRRGLRCGDARGDMYWTADYEIVATGDVNKFTGEFIWYGYLEGTGTTQWANCEENGEEIACPGLQNFEYRFDVVEVNGRVSCSGETAGKIFVRDQDINLATFGQWFATQVYPQQLFLMLQSGAATLNDLPLPLNCPVPVTIGDRLQGNLEGAVQQAKVSLKCKKDFEDLFQDVLDVSIKNKENADPYLLILLGAELPSEAENCIKAGAARDTGEAEAGLTFDLQQGSGNFAVGADGFPVEVSSPAAVTSFDPNGHVIIRTDEDSSEVASLRGQTTVTPNNSTLDPVVLNGAQQVDVTDDEVGAVIDLSQVNLPYVSREE